MHKYLQFGVNPCRLKLTADSVDTTMTGSSCLFYHQVTKACCYYRRRRLLLAECQFLLYVICKKLNSPSCFSVQRSAAGKLFLGCVLFAVHCTCRLCVYNSLLYLSVFTTKPTLRDPIFSGSVQSHRDHSPVPLSCMPLEQDHIVVQSESHTLT